ncbi:MAG: 50S ribosomal protein L24 [Alphaproteobacteria bacterium]|nr:50S ribosomal protein L24 [Alphaproteobacteria bacterium]
MAAKLKIKKKDRVIVLAGKDKGKTGEVIRVLPAEGRVVVQGINMVARHARASQQNPGGIIRKEASIHISNVAHVDPKDSKKPTRIGFKLLKDGRKARYAKRSGELIDA